MISNAFQQYQEANLETASQGKLLLMLYDGAIRFLTQALQAMEAKKFNDAHMHILKAEDIITELMSCLRMDVGEISANLFKLYEYMNWRLMQGNIKRDARMIEEVQGLLRSLREAWVEAVKATAQGATPAPLQGQGAA
jgi:flagellar protein FliS